MPMVSFYTPCKHHRTTGFLMFSGGIESGEMGLKYDLEYGLITL